MIVESKFPVTRHGGVSFYIRTGGRRKKDCRLIERLIQLMPNPLGSDNYDAAMAKWKRLQEFVEELEAEQTAETIQQNFGGAR